MTFDQDDPLNRISNETQKAKNALMDYFLMGPGRSLAKLRLSYVKSTLKKPPTIHLRTLQNWSARYHWQARIARQTENDNAIILERIENEKAKILEQYRQRHMDEAEALALLADQARGNMADFADIRTQSDLAKNPKSALVKTITHHYNQTIRGAKENAQPEIITTRFTLGLYDAQKALELILKHHGSFDADNKSEIIMKIEESPLEQIRSRIDSIAANKAAAIDLERPD